MIIFESAKKNLASLGYDANKRPFHRKQLSKVMQSFLAIVLECLYIVYDANTVREYINSIFMTTIGKYSNNKTKYLKRYKVDFM